MKIRFALLMVAALLSVASAAATAPPAGGGAAPAAVATATSATSSFSPACGTSLASLGAADISPAAVSLSAYNTCGSCSRNPCQGATYGTLCGFSGGQYGYCLSPLGDNCSDGITWKCQCWYGPLP
jgi:hypothetical protein